MSGPYDICLPTVRQKMTNRPYKRYLLSVKSLDGMQYVYITVRKKWLRVRKNFTYRPLKSLDRMVFVYLPFVKNWFRVRKDLLTVR